MRLTITTDQRFDRRADGSVWTPDAFSYAYWRPYLEVFDRVRVVGRVRDIANDAQDMVRVDGANVEVWPLPHYIGAWAFAKSVAPLASAVRDAVERGDAVILRTVPLAGLFRRVAIERGQPYGCEITGDPYDVFAPGVIDHPLRPLLRSWLTAEMKRQCWSAAAALYVTREYLQRRYPCRGPMFAASDAQLSSDAFVPSPRTHFPGERAFEIVAVGTLDQPYKGHDVLIDAAARLVRTGKDLRVTFVGGGRLRGELAALAASAGIGDRVNLTGALPGSAAVRERLDRADLFVMPSRTEGLPRALLEAMARALPCIGSAVGGIPELLDPADLVLPGDANALAVKIAEVVGSADRMRSMSEANLARAHEYEERRMLDVRSEFLGTLRELTRGAARR